MKQTAVIYAKKTYPLLSSKARILVWEQMRGMWKGRKPNPIRELARIRKEWDRKTI